MEIYKRPRELMEDISALGLRHVGYGIPTELFMPFVEAGNIKLMAVECLEYVQNMCCSKSMNIVAISQKFTESSCK